jgi:hypothetical protein
MEAQTLAFACVAALYPVGLLAVSLLLAGDRPMRLGLSFYAGAVTSLFLVGVVVISVMHGAGANRSGSTRGGFRMGVGAAMLFAAWAMSRPTRRRRAVNKEPAWRERLRGAEPLPVFFAGALLYSPSGSYLGAMTQIATTPGGWPWVVQLMLVIAIVLLTVEVPLIAYARRPADTAALLHRGESWIDRHGRQALITGLIVIGSYLFLDGISLVL